MLKVRYNLGTGMLSGWADNEVEFDNLIASEGEDTAVLDVAKPDSDDYEYFAFIGGELVPSGKLEPVPVERRDYGAEIDEINVILFGTETMPPLCTHWAIVDSVNLGSEKPVRVRRTWSGTEYTVNCYVTESVKDQYQAGDIAIGDYVMVEFLDDDPDRAVVFAKVFKTW